MTKESKQTCIFCKILSGETQSSEVYRDNLVVAFMDIQPVTPGHTLIIPIDHQPYMATVPPETAAHMFQIGQKIAAAIRKSDLKSEGINFFLSDGEAAMQEVFHSHLHVIPRFKGDGFGLKFGDDYSNLPSRNFLDESAKQITESLSRS